MSATAALAKELGYEVLGSDSKLLYDPAKSILDKHDIAYHIGYQAEHAADAKADIYIASAGENETNPEVAYLLSHDVKIYPYSELLYELAKNKLRVVVTGTHGKSTTAGLLGRVLQEIDDSSFMTGAVLQRDNTNYHQGEGHYFVFEGDEYKALHDDPTPKFHLYKPDITVLTNLEFDHPDVFASLEEVENEFRELLQNMPDDGLVVYNADSVELAKLVHESNLGQVTYGLHNAAHYRASNIMTMENETKFTVTKTSPQNEAEVSTETYRIKLFGEHNVYNALAAVATLRTLGFSVDQVQDGLDQYYGVKRRLEFLGVSQQGAKVFDDYAHHPTAVSETLKALKMRSPDKRVWAVFEPHTFSRTEAVLDELVTCFEQADQVLVAEVYPAREKATEHSITGQDLVTKIAKNHRAVRLVADKDQAKQILQAELQKDDVVVIMAVGNFNKLGYELIN